MTYPFIRSASIRVKRKLKEIPRGEQAFDDGVRQSFVTSQIFVIFLPECNDDKNPFLRDNLGSERSKEEATDFKITCSFSRLLLTTHDMYQ